MSTAFVLLVLGVILAVGYVAACAWWPYTKCPSPSCEGGKVRSPSGKAWRRHWWCGGSGSRVRWGRRVYDALSGHGWKADR